MLDTNACLGRQRRFQERLDRANLDAAILADVHEVYYFTGLLIPEAVPSLLFLPRSGKPWLVTSGDPAQPGDTLAERIVYPMHTLYTENPDLPRLLNRVLAKRLAGAAKVARLGWQSDAVRHLHARTIDEALRPDEWVA